MERNILLAIFISALVTALMRTVPILLLSRFRLAPALQQWLSFTAAIMAAIITAELLGKPALTPSGVSISLLAAAGCCISRDSDAQPLRDGACGDGGVFRSELFFDVMFPSPRGFPSNGCLYPAMILRH
jgi:branched-subunit amino acid transport protein